MKKMKKLLAILLVMAIVVSLAACATQGGGAPSTNSPSGGGGTSPSPSASPSGGESGGGGSEAPAATDRALNVAVSLDGGTLHPFGMTGAGGIQNVTYTYMEPLFDVMPDGSYMWLLATGIDYVSDINYTLHIREGVTFSNGNPLTAEDVMFSMELCLNDARVFLNVKVVDFEKTKVVDDYTIDLWYTEYNASQEPGFSQMFIFDKESYDEAAFSRNPVGTGPYVVTDYVVNSHITVEARDDYWGGTPTLKNVNFRVINEDAQRVNALEMHDVDIAYIPIKDADYVESLGYEVNLYGFGAMAAFYSMKPGTALDSKEARWAVSMAIDRQAVSDIVYSGMAKVLDWPASERNIDFEPRFANMHETYSVGYNPEKAREYAEASGLVGKKLRIITNGSSEFVTIAEVIQSDLSVIGVDSEIINYDQASYFATLMDESNFEIAVFNPGAPSGLAVDVIGMYPTFIPLGWTGADRDLFGEVSMRALGTVDPKVRGDVLYEALEVFLDATPWFGICESVSVRVTSTEVQGISYSFGVTRYNNITFAS